MTTASVSAFVDVLHNLPLLEPVQFAQLEALAAQFTDSEQLADELVRRGWLTGFQANQIAKGKGETLILDQYVVLELLGQGGMGEVFKARQTRMDRLVALKIIKREAMSTPSAVDRFRREAKAAARLAHANIVTVHDTNEVKGILFLVMEYIEGTDLARLVSKQGPLAVEQACDYVRQAALGLQHAHEQGLIHRDVKPHNLMLTKQGVVKVMDLGLVRLSRPAAEESGGLTGTGVMIGTPYYMAPEQALNAKATDIRSDVYSLGSTLYHLLAGKPPFADLDLIKIVSALVQQHRPERLEKRRPDVPAALLTVLDKMMAYRREDRYQTPTEVVAALEPFTADTHRASAATSSLAPTLTNPPQAEIETTSARSSVSEGMTTPIPEAGPSSPSKTAAWSRPARRSRPVVVLVAIVLMAAAGWAGWQWDSLIAWFEQVTGRPTAAAVAQVPEAAATKPATHPDTGLRRPDTGPQKIPPATPVLRLLPLGDVTLTAGGKQTLRVRVQRENCKGPVTLSIAGLPNGVSVKPSVIPADADSADVELSAAADVGAATQSVQLVASAGEARAQYRFRIILKPAPSLRLVGLNDITLEAGQKQDFRVRVQRGQSKGPIELRLEGLPKGVSAKPGLVPADADLGEVEVTARADAGEVQQTVKLLALAGDARTEASLRVIVKRAALAKSITIPIDIKLVLIPAGKFMMGSPKDEKDRSSVEEQHEVEISKPFYLGIHTVTVGQFRQFVTDSRYQTEAEKDGKGGFGYDAAKNASAGQKPIYSWRNVGFAQTDHHPVVNVSWNDAQQFCAWASKKTGRRVELPTEAEWEYACRAGTTTRYFTGDDPDSLAGYANVPDQTLKDKNVKGMTNRGYFDFRDGYAFTAPVGTFKPNPWGLYDMTGNVFQWCRDGLRQYRGNKRVNPVGPDDSDGRAVRGGSWQYSPKDCRSASRWKFETSHRNSHLGFRVLIRPE